MSEPALFQDKQLAFEFDYFTIDGSSWVRLQLADIYGELTLDKYNFNPLDSMGRAEIHGTTAVDIPMIRDVDLSMGVITISDLFSPDTEVVASDFSKNYEIALNPETAMADVKQYFKHGGPWPLSAEWTHGNSPSKAYRMRAGMMQQPFYTIATAGPSSPTSLFGPFDSFRRINSLVISGIPAFRDDGYLDALTGFTYTNVRTLFGMGRAASPFEGVGNTLIAVPLNNFDVTGYGTTHKFDFIDDAYKSDLNVRLDSTYPTFGCGVILKEDFYQGASNTTADRIGDSAAYISDLPGGPVRERRRYHNTLYNTFYARVDYEYLKGTNGAISEAHPRQNSPAGTYSTFETDYIAQRDYHDSKVLNYRYTRTSCGRLPPYGALVFYRKNSADRAAVIAADDSTATTMAIPTINAASITIYDTPMLGTEAKLTAQIKTHFPRPADGRTLNFETTAITSTTVPATKDCTAEVGSGVDGSDLFPGSGNTVDELRQIHANDLLDGIYTMYWDNHGVGGDRQQKVRALKRNMKEHFGSPLSSFINAYIHMRTSLKTLNAAWTYDDAPREARIRMQRAKKLSPESFSALQQGYVQETDLGTNNISFESDTDESPEEY